MSKSKFERSRPVVNIGTIGHINLGKHTLTAAITRLQANTSACSTFVARPDGLDVRICWNCGQHHEPQATQKDGEG